MRELEFIKYCSSCRKFYSYDEFMTSCTCGHLLSCGFRNELGELEKSKFVSADVIYKNEYNECFSWHYETTFPITNVDMFYGWDGYFDEFFEQEAQMRKDNFVEFVRLENLLVKNPNSI